MIQASLEIDGAEGLESFLAGAREAVATRWFDTTRKHALKNVRTIQTRYRSGSATTATSTRVGTGALRASYAELTQRIPDGVQSQMGLYRFGAQGRALVYGAVHEEGAIIRPVRAKALAIPLPSIRSASGISPKPSDFPRKETFVLKGKFGSGVICRRLSDGTVQPLFALRGQVVIPARPQGGAINAVVNEDLPSLEADLLNDLVDVFGGAA